MDNQIKAVYGAWTAAIGTILSAIGSTPFDKISEETKKALNLWGNVMQAAGNALLADSEEGFSIDKFGNEIQSVGNSTVIAGLIMPYKEETKQKLNITGNWFQALGGAAAFGDRIDHCSSREEVFDLLGNLLQAIGNSMQALSGAFELKDIGENNESLDVSGSWIQAIGSVLSLIGVLAEQHSHAENENDQGEKLNQEKQ